MPPIRCRQLRRVPPTQPWDVASAGNLRRCHPSNTRKFHGWHRLWTEGCHPSNTRKLHGWHRLRTERFVPKGAIHLHRGNLRRCHPSVADSSEGCHPPNRGMLPRPEISEGATHPTPVNSMGGTDCGPKGATHPTPVNYMGGTDCGPNGSYRRVPSTFTAETSEGATHPLQTAAKGATHPTVGCCLGWKPHKVPPIQHP